MSTSAAAVIAIVLLVVGTGAGYFAGQAAAPRAAPSTVTRTVTGAPTTVTSTVTTTATVTAPAAVKNKIGIVFDIGGRGDLSFNDMAALGGSNAARDFGLEVIEVQSRTEADYLPNLRTLARRADVLLIVGVGFLLTEAVTQVAKEFRAQKFAIIDGFIPDVPNVLSVLYKEHEGSAVVGLLAALVAREFNFKKIGVVLGIEIPVLWKFEVGYKWGARWAADWAKQNKPDRTFTYTKDLVLWTYTGSFTDPAKGKTAAEAQFAQGACCVYNVAGLTGKGIFDAAEAIGTGQGKTQGPPYGIGVDADQDWVKPGWVVVSMMKRVDVGIYTAARLALADQVKPGTWKGGILALGMKEAGIAISELADLDTFLQIGVQAGTVKAADRDKIFQQVKAMRARVPDWIWTAARELADAIKSGQIQVPEAFTKEAIEKWRAELG